MRAAAGLAAALALAAPAAAQDADRRARAGDFDAHATVRCAQEIGDAMAPCEAAIARGAEGDAAVVVTFPSGFRRRLSFEAGRFVRGDATMSGVGTDVDWVEVQGAHRIRVDDQRFEIPAALVAPDG